MPYRSPKCKSWQTWQRTNYLPDIKQTRENFGTRRPYAAAALWSVIALRQTIMGVILFASGNILAGVLATIVVVALAAMALVIVRQART